MAATVTAVGNTWTQVAADITAVTILQCVATGNAEIEILAAGTTPGSTDHGIRMNERDTLGSTQLGDVGSSGKIYARRLVGSDVKAIVL